MLCYVTMYFAEQPWYRLEKENEDNYRMKLVCRLFKANNRRQPLV